MKNNFSPDDAADPTSFETAAKGPPKRDRVVMSEVMLMINIHASHYRYQFHWLLVGYEINLKLSTTQVIKSLLRRKQSVRFS